VIPYSLEYYLNIHDDEFEDEEDLDAIEENDESDSDDGKKKKKSKCCIKKKCSRKTSKEECKEGQ